ncbi:MAG: CpaF family protein [archaeon]
MANYLDEFKSKFNSVNDIDSKSKVAENLQTPANQINSTFKTNGDNLTINKPISTTDNLSQLSTFKSSFNSSNNNDNNNSSSTIPTMPTKPIIPRQEDIPNSNSSDKTNQNKNSNDEDLMFNSDNSAENSMPWMTSKKTLVTKYDDVEIYRIEGENLLHYQAPIPKPNPRQKLIINTLKEATTRLISSDPYRIRDPVQRRNIYYQKILDILNNAPEINIPKHMYEFYAQAVVKEMVGYGLIDPLLHDDKLEELMIIGPNKPTYVYHIDYGMMTTNIVFFTDEEIKDIIDKIARSLGRRVDISSPLLDARLPDGSRVNATIPPASIDGSTVTIRKFKADPYTITDLIRFGTVNVEVAAFLWCLIEGFKAKPANIVIAGGTGSGKTTLLNVLANFIPESDRVLTIEDTAELRLPMKHVIRFEGRPPGLEGSGELSLDILTKNTLRMRPDRIIVGEIRHKEAYALFTAMNTGHDGCMGTVHANSARETLVRITSPPMEVPPLMLAGLDFIIVQKRINTAKGQARRIISISEITGVLDNNPQANLIFNWNPNTDSLERTSEAINYFEIIKSYTKFTDADIKNALAEKIKILNNMVHNNIREIDKVAHEIQKSYLVK